MSEKQKKDKSSKNKQYSNSQELMDWIRDSVRTEITEQQASNTPIMAELVREAVRKEMDALQSRKHTTEAYTQRLHDNDARVTDFIKQAITETTRAYRLTVNSYVISHFAAFIVLITGLVMIFITKGIGNFFNVALVFIGSSIIWIIILQNRSPVKSSRYMINHLAKLNVIFSGYFRQIHQVDAVFEELVGNGKELTPKDAEELLNNLQDAMSEAMNAISVTSDEFGA
jgi:hypothetical protein